MVSSGLLVAAFVLVVMSVSGDVAFAATPLLPPDAAMSGSRSDSINTSSAPAATHSRTGGAELVTTLGESLPGGEQEDGGREERDEPFLPGILTHLSLLEEREAEVPRCQQPVQTGMCRGMYRMWYYDTATTTCTMFIYGGCGGNDNNFLTEAHCRAACPDVVACPEDPSRTCLVSASACVNATCPAEPDAICRVTPCTCLPAFVNEVGDPVRCEEQTPVPSPPAPSSPAPSPPASSPPTPSPPASFPPTSTPTLTEITTITPTTSDEDEVDELLWVTVVCVAGGVILAGAMLWALVRHCRLHHKGLYIIFLATTNTDRELRPAKQVNALDSTPGKFKELSHFPV
nr:uncharacterized protein LOC123763639 [Procambarus clarkii]